MSFRKTRSFSVLYMFILSAIFAGVISLVKVGTAEQIQDNDRIAASKSLVRVFELMEITPATTGAELAAAIEKQVRKFWVVEGAAGPELVSTQPSADTQVLYRMWAAVDESGAPFAYAFPIGGKGFWGPIQGLMSVETDFITIRTVVWTKHSETPGLGARIEEDQYRAKFRGKRADNPAAHRFQVVPDGTMGNDPHKIDQITGATQTTVVGMGKFLNDNFTDWHRYYPLLKQHFGAPAPANEPETQQPTANDGQE